MEARVQTMGDGRESKWWHSEEEKQRKESQWEKRDLNEGAMVLG